MNIMDIMNDARDLDVRTYMQLRTHLETVQQRSWRYTRSAETVQQMYPHSTCMGCIALVMVSVILSHSLPFLSFLHLVRHPHRQTHPTRPRRLQKVTNTSEASDPHTR
jgi:hypothetical protein